MRSGTRAVAMLLSSAAGTPAEAGETPAPRLDAHALANRLAYFLWNSRPDDALLARAADGTLRDVKILRAEAERLLRDPKAERFIEGA